MKRLLTSLAASLFALGALLAVSLAPAVAQVPSAQAVYNYKTDLGALMNFTSRSIGDYQTADQTNSYGRGVYCVFNKTQVNATAPLTVWSIQIKDAATAAWTTVATAALTQAVTATTGVAQQGILLYPGIATSSLPAQISALGIPVPLKWRVSLSIAGSGALGGKIGCNTLP